MSHGHSTIMVAVDFEQLRDAGHNCTRGQQVRWRLGTELEVTDPTLRIAHGDGYVYDEYGFLDSSIRVPATVVSITEVSYPLVATIGTPYLSDIDRSRSDERAIDAVDPERMYQELVHAMETGIPPSQPLPPPNRHVEYRVELQINQASADKLATARAEITEAAARQEAETAARQTQIDAENLTRMTDPVGAALAALATEAESRYSEVVTVSRAEDHCAVSIVPLPTNVGGLSIDMDDLDGFHQFLTDDAVVPADTEIPTQAAVHWSRPVTWDPEDADEIEVCVGTGRWLLPATTESVQLIRTLLEAASAGRAKAVVQTPEENPFVDDPLKEDFELEGSGEQLVTVLWDEDGQQYQAADPHTQLWPDPEDDGFTFTTPGAAVTGFVGKDGFDYEPWLPAERE
ncbi:hypothetical protein [Micrococcoides hystricis]|uniref:Uncharacterized protein n=1 Tax=Micrococcoides hystricis TaxID=1572761 RepID=A0ABV6PC28_9MICC